MHTSTNQSKILTFSLRFSESETFVASVTPHHPPLLRLEGNGFAFVSLLRDEVARSWKEGSVGEERDRESGRGLRSFDLLWEGEPELKAPNEGLEHDDSVSRPLRAFLGSAIFLARVWDYCTSRKVLVSPKISIVFC